MPHRVMVTSGENSEGIQDPVAGGAEGVWGTGLRTRIGLTQG